MAVRKLRFSIHVQMWLLLLVNLYLYSCRTHARSLTQFGIEQGVLNQQGTKQGMLSQQGAQQGVLNQQGVFQRLRTRLHVEHQQGAHMASYLSAMAGTQVGSRVGFDPQSMIMTAVFYAILALVVLLLVYFLMVTITMLLRLLWENVLRLPFCWSKDWLAIPIFKCARHCMYTCTHCCYDD